MADLSRLRNILQLLVQMRNPAGCNKLQFAKDHEIDKRTFERYLQLLKQVGFSYKREGGRYRLALPEAIVKHEDFLIFSLEEAELIKSALLGLKKKNPLLRSTLDKLYSVSALEELSQSLAAVGVSENLSLLKKAVKEEKQVVLEKYRSGSSQTIKDRTVEPISITRYYQHLVAYDLDTKEVKTFRIDRISNVKLLRRAWKNKDKHEQPGTDMFGMSGKKPVRVVLELSELARNLLIEEFPAAERFIKQTKDKYLMEVGIYDFKGVGRFVAGCMDQVKVLEPAGLIDHVWSMVSAFRKVHEG